MSTCMNVHEALRGAPTRGRQFSSSMLHTFLGKKYFWGKIYYTEKSKHLRATRPVPISMACRHGSRPSEAIWPRQPPKTRGRKLNIKKISEKHQKPKNILPVGPNS